MEQLIQRWTGGHGAKGVGGMLGRGWRGGWGAGLALPLLVMVGCDVGPRGRDPGEVANAFVERLTESRLLERPVDFSCPLLAQRIIVVTGEINELTSAWVCQKLLFLDAVDSSAPIDLYVKTFGGWQADAFAIIDVMQRISAPVNTWAMGDCSSSGAMILVAGTGVRRALPHALIMVHVVEERGEDPHSYERVSRLRFESFLKRR
ncbi:MAG: ATP-dependent Clp protease proteolytic subunit, partial [Verrucomicrobiia bacterium]